MVVKDANYWKEYNRKRGEYIQQKNKERYLKNKGINTTTSQSELIQLPKLIQPIQPVQKNNTTEKLIQLKEPEKINTTKSEKWSFELFLEQFGYTNPNNPRGVYFSPEQIEAQKSLYREYETKITVKNNPPIHLPSTNQNQVKTTINTLYE